MFDAPPDQLAKQSLAREGVGAPYQNAKSLHASLNESNWNISGEHRNANSIININPNQPYATSANPGNLSSPGFENQTQGQNRSQRFKELLATNNWQEDLQAIKLQLSKVEDKITRMQNVSTPNQVSIENDFYNQVRDAPDPSQGLDG